MSFLATPAPHRGALVYALLTVAILTLVTAPTAIGQSPLEIDPEALCTIPFDPIPTGAVGKPMEGFPATVSPTDHLFIHSSTHLQGRLAQTKWAGGLVYQPAGTAFDEYTSVVVVNNPDPVASCTVDIDYFDAAGANVQSTLGLVIGPEEFQTDAPSMLAAAAGGLGVGAAEITVTNGCPGIVGAVLTHTDEVLGITDPDIIPFSPVPGASSKQQLQVVQQTKTELWWGPLPFTHTSAIDFFNGNLPAFWVVNPNDADNTIQIDLVVYDQASGNVVANLPWRNVTLPANGTLFEASGPHLGAIGATLPGVWDAVLDLYFPPLSLDWDFVFHVTSESGLPILGDGLFTDFVGDDGGDNLLPGGRFRMASTMLSNTPNWQLINPDFSYDRGGVIHTLMGIANVGTTDAGPVSIEYFDAAGTIVGVGSVASLPPNASIRIEPGTFGYPASTVGFGWARIRGCTPAADLIGWSVREVLDIGTAQYQKAFGETLLGINGTEPGPGFDAADLTRKLKPISRVDPFLAWPGYTTLGNLSVSNIGAYDFELHFGSVTFSCGTLGPFAGLPFADTATTYEDSFNVCTPESNVSVSVDHENGEIEGIGVIGDPFIEWGIPGLADQ